MRILQRTVLLFWLAQLPLAACAEQKALRNPLLDRYRSWALQYEKDAQEAEAAAQKYSYMTQEVVASAGGGVVNTAVAQELAKSKAKELAQKVWKFEARLRDPRPVDAAAAAEVAAKPYREEWKEYTAARNKYAGAAAQHALRAKSDGELAMQLQSYSDQNQVEGNKLRANTYKTQASTLMKQVASEEGLAKEYNSMAEKITGVLPDLWNMQFTAANYAAYHANPTGSLPSTQLYPYTVAPPPLDAVQQVLAGQAAAMGGVPPPR